MSANDVVMGLIPILAMSLLYVVLAQNARANPEESANYLRGAVTFLILTVAGLIFAFLKKQ